MIVRNFLSGVEEKPKSTIYVTGLNSTDTVYATSPSGKELTPLWDGTQFVFNVDELGSYTITASNGTKTKTETVLVDEVGEYTVPWEWVLWLYKDGDECEDVTGGWVKSWGNGAGASRVTFNKNASSMYVTCSQRWDVGYGEGGCSCSRLIDITDVSSIHVSATVGKNSRNQGLFIMAAKALHYSSASPATYINVSVSGEDLQLDVSSLAGTYYLFLHTIGGSNATITKVWLE